MPIETAIYGEVNNGHGLRYCSGDKDYARRVAGRMDIPSTPPPGVLWSPYPSGFVFEDRYVLARTFLDPSAPRGNMVITQALIIPLDEMVQVTNLGDLFDQMAQAPEELVSPQRSVESEARADPMVAEDLGSAANALVAKGVGPAVRIGLDKFEDLVGAIWANLWPEARAAFSFRLSFTPQDVVEAQAPSLVATPTSLMARWTGQRVMSAAQEPLNLAAEILAGRRPSEPILEFGRSIGADVSDLGKLSRLEQAQTLVATGNTFEAAIGGLRLIDHLSPSPSVGDSVKTSIVTGAARAVSGASSNQIFALRNLELAGFSKSRVLWDALETWAANHAYAVDGSPTLPEILEATARTSAAVPDWKAAVTRGARRALLTPKSRLATSLWSWLDDRPSLIPAAFEFLPEDVATGAVMSAAAPDHLSGETADLRARALERGWLNVHGSVLAASEPPIEAARQQIAVDSDVRSQAGLEAALRHATDQNLLEAAEMLGDERLISRAAKAVVKRPKGLSAFSIETVNAQRIWAAALQTDLETWKAPAKPEAIRDALLSKSLDGVAVHLPLFDLIAKTPLADLGGYPRQTEVWPETRFGPVFLAASAKGWIERAQGGEITQPDRILEQAILGSNSLSDVFTGAEREPAQGVRIAASLPSLDQSIFTAWVQSSMSLWSALTKGDAELLGGLISERHWAQTLALLLERYRAGRRDLKPALRSAAHLLALWDKWIEGLSTPTIDEKWESFIGVASELYPLGPGQRELWDRAGGKSAELPKAGTGVSLWRAAVFLVRKGGRPSSAALLHEMRRDFATNAELRFLAQDTDITSMR